jgi:hypothetical protein
MPYPNSALYPSPTLFPSPNPLSGGGGDPVADYTKPSDDPEVLVEPTTNRDGISLGTNAKAQVVLLGRNPSDGRVDTFDPNDLIPNDAGTYGYATGNTTASVDVPTGARITRVIAIPSSGGAVTVKILGNPTITLPTGWTFDEQIPGQAVAAAGADVLIGGQCAFYYVAWVS